MQGTPAAPRPAKAIAQLKADQMVGSPGEAGSSGSTRGQNSDSVGKGSTDWLVIGEGVEADTEEEVEA